MLNIFGATYANVYANVRCLYSTVNRVVVKFRYYRQHIKLYEWQSKTTYSWTAAASSINKKKYDEFLFWILSLRLSLTVVAVPFISLWTSYAHRIQHMEHMEPVSRRLRSTYESSICAVAQCACVRICGSQAAIREKTHDRIQFAVNGLCINDIHITIRGYAQYASISDGQYSAQSRIFNRLPNRRTHKTLIKWCPLGPLEFWT